MKTLRVERPYDTVEAYLDGDAWTVDRSERRATPSGAPVAAPGNRDALCAGAREDGRGRAGGEADERGGVNGRG